MNTFRHYLLMLLIIAIPIVGYAYNDNEQFSKDGNHYRVVSGTVFITIEQPKLIRNIRV